jgi:hypothetical protein
MTELSRREINVTIGAEDVRFLADLVRDEELRALLRSKLEAEPAKTSRRIGIRFTRGQADTMLNCLSDLLSEIGLDDRDEPNSTGLRIEALIDVVNHELWEVKAHAEE